MFVDDKKTKQKLYKTGKGDEKRLKKLEREFCTIYVFYAPFVAEIFDNILRGENWKIRIPRKVVRKPLA